MKEEKMDPLSFLEDLEVFPNISIGEESEEELMNRKFGKEFPLIPLRNTVLFPGIVLPITVGRDFSVKAVRAAYKGDKLCVVSSQRDPQVEQPQFDDIHSTGTLAKIVRKLKMPDGGSTVIIQGLRRVEIEDLLESDPFFRVKASVLDEPKSKDEEELKAIVSSIKELSETIIMLNPNIPKEASKMISKIENPRFLIHFLGSNLSAEVGDKQAVIEVHELNERASLVLEYMNQEVQMLELKNQIQNKVRSDMDKQQKDYFLYQQMKTIQEELGTDPVENEVQKLRDKAARKKWGKKESELFERELLKVQRINPAAAEYSVLLNYLDLMLDLPWNEMTKDNFNLKRAQKVLDEDHYGLDKVKDRIMEYLAVLKLKGDMKSPIICLVGPPGVGKTSLGRSVARALDRKYVRMSLGGLHDESEIRGHRKTYIGAMPGRLIQSIKKAGSSNPVFILDEIDKVGKDFRGDPSSALLEVLDPEQNSAFYDNYLETEYDLSKVLFIATANSLSTIQPALRDRMEIIPINGYSVEEKVEIASRHLVAKQRKAHGLNPKQVSLGKRVLQNIVEDYTRESGVRELDRQIARVMRQRAKAIAFKEKFETAVRETDLEDLLGKPKYDRGFYREKHPPGVAVGLAWTQVGGDMLFIESTSSKGKPHLTLTGNLGEVMKESASTALSFIKANAKKLGIGPTFFDQREIHIHVPEGAIPKDGPSAGITILTALVSLFLGKSSKRALAMSGEITLRGKVLPVGGIKEKILAAKRSGMKEIILCSKNEKDVQEVNQSFIKGVKFHYVDHMSEVLEIALGLSLNSQKGA